MDSTFGSPPQAADPELIALAPCVQFPLPDNRVLLVRRHSDARMVVTGEVLRALGLCASFRTLAQHAEVLVQAYPDMVENLDDARNVLSSLKSAGLFMSSRDIQRLVDGGLAQRGRDAPITVCVSTCDRPALLERVLASLLTHPREGQLSYWVVDDSRQDANIAKNHLTTQQAAASYGVKLGYWGPSQQQARVAQLKQRLPQLAREIDFLLSPASWPGLATYGRSLNHALLLSRGGVLVYLDDDTLCRGYGPPVATSNQLSMNHQRRDAAFLPEGPAWEHGAAEVVDPVTEFARFAGRSPFDVMADLQGRQGCEFVLGGAGTPQGAALLSGRAAVAAVTCGIYGDPGTSGHQWLFDLQGASRERLIRDEGTYRRAKTERNVWLGHDHYHLGLDHSMLSVNKAFDHRRPLPPAFPLLRNEDLLFGKMLARMHPDSLFLELPWAVPHLPAERRMWPDDMLDRPLLVGLLRFSVHQLMNRQAMLTAMEPFARLEMMGCLFSDLGRAGRDTLREEIALCLTSLRSDGVNRLGASLSGGGPLPEYYQRDLIRQLQVNEKALLNMGAPGPYDVFESFPHQDPLLVAGDLLRRFGSAILGWEAILAASGELP